MKQMKNIKKNRRSILSAAWRGTVAAVAMIVALSFASCNVNDNTEDPNKLPEGQYPIEFKTATSDASAPQLTRATTPDLTAKIFISKDSFNTIKGGKYIGTNGSLKYATINDASYWKTNADIVEAWGVSPYMDIENGTEFTFTIETDQNAKGNYKKSDLMKTTNKEISFADRNTDNKLVFSHVLCRLSIALNFDAIFTQDEIDNASVIISGVKVSNDYTFSGNGMGYQNLSDAQEITALNEGNNKFAAILHPSQRYDAGDPLIIIKVGSLVFTYKTPTDLLFNTAGVEHPYAISVNKTGMKVSQGTITKWDDAEAPEVVNAYTYQVGNYYPDPNVVINGSGQVTSGTAPEGIVFWVDPTSDGKSGKIVALKDESDGSNTTFKWSTFNENIGPVSANPIYDDGTKSITAITNYLNANTTRSWSDFPAFYVIQQNRNGGSASGWYLPAIWEHKAIFAGMHGTNYSSINQWGYGESPNTKITLKPTNFAAFNAKLTKAGGSKLYDVSGSWMSSTERANTNSSFFGQNKDGDEGYLTKSNSYFVRAIKKF